MLPEHVCVTQDMGPASVFTDAGLSPVIFSTACAMPSLLQMNRACFRSEAAIARQVRTRGAEPREAVHPPGEPNVSNFIMCSKVFKF